MNQYNVWNKWDKLKTVMLGDTYSSEFYRDIKNNKIRGSLQKIADETQQELEYFESVLKDFGCEVIRPELDRSDSIMNYIDNNGQMDTVPRAPLQPRDAQFVAGNTLYYTNLNDHPNLEKRLNAYSSDNNYELTRIDTIKYHPVLDKKMFDSFAGSDWLTYEDYLCDDYFERVPEFVKNEIARSHYDINALFSLEAPSLTVVGKDVYYDAGADGNIKDSILENQKRILNDLFKNNFRVNALSHGGHSDGCFHTIKPGAILSLDKIQKYQNTFPGWDVCYLPDQSWSKVEGFLNLKLKNGGKWWVPGEESNDEFTYFVETWLQDWVGYVEETVFDVNVLVLDEHHVCVNNMNPTVTEFLKKHKMEPVHIPWRHRYFWDGGLHCITLDLYREGSQQDYFPDRTEGLFDPGFPE